MGGKYPTLRVAQLVERRIVDHWRLLNNSPQVIGSIPVSKSFLEKSSAKTDIFSKIKYIFSGPLAQW